MSVTPRILLIDFEQKSRTATSQLLENAGYDVRLAGNGSEVEQALRDDAPHLVLLEPMIPGQDGFQLCKKLKSGGANAPKIVIASRIYKGSRHRGIARDNGADAFLERPNQDSEILSTVEALLPDLEATPRAAPQATVIDHAEEPAIDDILDNLWSSDDVAVSVAPTAAALSAVAAESADQRPQADKEQPEPELVAVAAVARGEEELSSSAGAAAQAKQENAPAMATVFPDDLGMALDRLSWGGNDSRSKAAQVLENPFSYNDAGEPPEEQTSAALESAGFELATDSQALSSEPVVSAPPPAVESAKPEPTADLPIPAADDTAKKDPAPGPAPALEQELDKIFGSADSPDRPQAAPAKTEAETPVPENLQGMDAGTADLLSSLEQLENSLPEENASPEAVAATPRAAEFGSSINELETSVPHQPPEPSVEEQTLGDVLSDIVSSSGVDQPDSEEEISAIVPEPEMHFCADDGDDLTSQPPPRNAADGPKNSTGRRWMLATFSIVLLVAAAGAAGLIYTRHHASSALAPQDSPAFEQQDSKALSQGESPATEPVPITNDPPAARKPESERAAPPSSRRQTPSPSSPVEKPNLAPKTRMASGNETARPPASEPKPRAAGADEVARPASSKRADSQTAAAATDEPATKKPASTSKIAVRNDQARDRNAPPPSAAGEPRFVMANEQPESVSPEAVRKMPDTTAAREARPEPVAAAQRSETTRARDERPTPAVGVTDDEKTGDPEPASANTPPETRSRLNVEKRRGGMGSLPPAPEPPPAPDPLRKPAKLVRYNELDRPLKRLVAELPMLPEAAREAGVEARAFVSVLIDQSGRVKDARVMIEPGYGLGDAARTAVLSWSYSPPRHKGKPARVWKSEVVEFRRPQLSE